MSQTQKLLLISVRSGPLAGKAYQIPAGTILTFGRTSSANIVFSNDNFMSGLHFEVENTGAFALIRDRGSSNKTWVNQKSIVEATVGNGDQIRAGKTEFYASWSSFEDDVPRSSNPPSHTADAPNVYFQDVEQPPTEKSAPLAPRGEGGSQFDSPGLFGVQGRGNHQSQMPLTNSDTPNTVNPNARAADSQVRTGGADKHSGYSIGELPISEYGGSDRFHEEPPIDVSFFLNEGEQSQNKSSQQAWPRDQLDEPPQLKGSSSTPQPPPSHDGADYSFSVSMFDLGEIDEHQPNLFVGDGKAADIHIAPEDGDLTGEKQANSRANPFLAAYDSPDVTSEILPTSSPVQEEALIEKENLLGDFDLYESLGAGQSDLVIHPLEDEVHSVQLEEYEVADVGDLTSQANSLSQDFHRLVLKSQDLADSIQRVTRTLMKLAEVSYVVHPAKLNSTWANIDCSPIVRSEDLEECPLWPVEIKGKSKFEIDGQLLERLIANDAFVLAFGPVNADSLRKLTWSGLSGVAETGGLVCWFWPSALQFILDQCILTEISAWLQTQVRGLIYANIRTQELIAIASVDTARQLMAFGFVEQ